MKINILLKIIAIFMLVIFVLSSCSNNDFSVSKDKYEQHRESIFESLLDSTQNTTETAEEDTDTSASVPEKSEINIPTYWVDELKSKTKSINQAFTNIGSNKASFLFYTDTHWDKEGEMSPLLLQYLYENTGITKTIFGGDIVQEESENYEAMEYLWEWRNMIKNLPNHHSVVGNHDDGNENEAIFSEEYVYGYLLAPEESSDAVYGKNGLYYYIDNKIEKTRYLYLDTAYIGVNISQLEFVKNALLSTPDEWHIIAISHIWYNIDYDSGLITNISDDAQKLLTIFDKYNARSEEFASCNAFVEFCIGGHTHIDYTGKSEGGIPIILIETDSGATRNGAQYKYKKGTTNEASVNAVIVDYNTRKINIIRIGRGESRIVNLIPKVIEKDSNDILSKALDLDGSNIYNGIGYKKGVRWSTSQQKEINKGGHYLSGWIKVTKGDVIYINNVNMNKSASASAVFFTNQIGSTEATINMETLSNIYNAEWDEYGNLIKFKVKDNYTYMRIQCEEINEYTTVIIN